MTVSLPDNTTGRTVLTKTDDYTVTIFDFGKTVRMNSADDKTFTLPVVDAAYDGRVVRLCKIGSGKLTIDSKANAKIGDGTIGGTVYLDEAADLAAYLDFEWVNNKKTWNITGPGAWITT